MAVIISLSANSETYISDGDNVFTLYQLRGMEIETIPVNQLFTENTAISLFSYSHPLTGLCLDAVVTATRSDYFVRVLLKDKNNDKYVVMERYPELNDSLSFHLDNYCEETALLNNIRPDSLIIYTKNVSLFIKSVKVSFSNGEKGSDNLIQTSQIENLKKEQVGHTIDKINSYNRSHAKIWIAGMRKIALKEFSDKMRLLGIPQDQPTGGLEYYVAGIFEMGDFSNGYPQIRSDYVSSFDWRNRHGKNWITSVKHQGKAYIAPLFQR